MQPDGNRKIILSFRLEHLVGWGVTFALCLVPIVLWEHIHPLSTIHGFIPTILNMGRIAGLVGTVMYALNLVYATRWRFLEFWFGGLNRVYIAHHMLGGLALILLSLHPLFLALRYVTTDIKQAALLLVPNGLFPVNQLFNSSAEFHQVILQQWAIMFGVIAFWGMVALLLITFFIKIPYRIWLFTHKFLGVAFFIAGLHILFISSDTSKNMPMKVFILCMVALGLLAFAYKTLAGNIAIRKFHYIVTNVKIVGGSVTQVSMRPQAERMAYKPGQFIFVRFRNGGKIVGREWHPFSISSAPNEEELEVSIKALGDYTNKLPELQIGAVADIEGAYGRFSYTNFNSTKQIWIGAGIGIAPFLSMAKNLPTNGSCQVDLYYIVRTESEIFDWSKLYNLAITSPTTLRIFPYIGDKQTGHLDANFIEKVSGNLKGRDYYICGPTGIMQDLRVQLKAKGIPGTSIHTEEFGMA